MSITFNQDFIGHTDVGKNGVNDYAIRRGFDTYIVGDGVERVDPYVFSQGGSQPSQWAETKPINLKIDSDSLTEIGRYATGRGNYHSLEIINAPNVIFIHAGNFMDFQHNITDLRALNNPNLELTTSGMAFSDGFMNQLSDRNPASLDLFVAPPVATFTRSAFHQRFLLNASTNPGNVVFMNHGSKPGCFLPTIMR
jgi:hypothetical protein